MTELLKGYHNPVAPASAVLCAEKLSSLPDHVQNPFIYRGHTDLSAAWAREVASGAMGVRRQDAQLPRH